MDWSDHQRLSRRLDEIKWWTPTTPEEDERSWEAKRALMELVVAAGKVGRTRWSDSSFKDRRFVTFYPQSNVKRLKRLAGRKELLRVHFNETVIGVKFRETDELKFEEVFRLAYEPGVGNLTYVQVNQFFA